jgi:hypothetical protein
LKRHGKYEAVARAGLEGETPLIQRFIDGEYKGAAQTMLDAFRFFAPDWISPERAAGLPSPPA